MEGNEEDLEADLDTLEFLTLCLTLSACEALGNSSNSCLLRTHYGPGAGLNSLPASSHLFPKWPLKEASTSVPYLH